MNAGRYGDNAVLSPESMALRHIEPTTGPYGFGWEFVESGGRTLIAHDGGTANFQSSVFIDPEAHVGVFIAANVINALDTFSSPHGASPLDGPTVRAMAHVVLSLATNRPLPSQGPGHERLTAMFNLTIAALSAVLILSLARLSRWRRRVERRGLPSWPAFLRRSGLSAAANGVIPVAVGVASCCIPAWKVITAFQPDLGLWIETVALVLLIKLVVEIAFAWRVFKRTSTLTVLPQ